jgi:hypothetical protein
MPSTATITAFYSFSPTSVDTPQKIKSSEVNNNFSTFRGHLCSVDASLSALANMSYDLGSYDHSWRNAYARGLFLMGTTTGDTPATTGVFNLYGNPSTGKIYAKTSALDKPLMYYADSIPASQLTGSVAEINGGTAQTTYTKGDILYASAANTLAKLSIGSTGQALQVGAAGTPGWTSSGASIFSNFTSVTFNIVSGATTITAHGLGASPSLIQLRLVNVTGEHGYTTGNEYMVNWNSLSDSASDGYGAAITPDATNLRVRYGNAGGVFGMIQNTSSSAPVAITNANWALKVNMWR